MKTLFEKTDVYSHGKAYVETTDDIITYIGEKRPEGKYDRIIDTKNRMIFPGLYNCHSHVAMQFMRGFAEDMPLKKWLDDTILPAEDRLTDKAVYISSLFGIAEMIRNGICSFSDMYFFSDQTCKAICESGIKANVSRSVVSFDPDADFSKEYRFTEGKELVKKYNHSSDGRLKIEMSLHAEYTNLPGMMKCVADFAKENGLGIHIHLSETKRETEKCIAKYGKTPAEVFYENGVFDVPVTAAHCVYLSDNDIEIMKNNNAVAVHCPVSNLKLASGIMPLGKILSKGVKVAVGTDSAASNNTLDIIKELQYAALLQKGTELDPASVKAEQIISLATKNGAFAQRRENSGSLEVGNKADIIMIDTDRINNIPWYGMPYTLLYSACSQDVVFNMTDGRILYENGVYTTLDIEKLKFDMKELVKHYFD